MTWKWLISSSARFFSILLISLVALTACIDEPRDTALEQEIAAIDQHIATAGAFGYLIEDNSGIRILIQDMGLMGPPPKPGQDVTFNYTGRLLASGTPVFANNAYDDDFDAIVPSGLKYAISGLMNGAIARIYIPSRYGYGSSGSGDIPANAVLIYDIQITGVERTASQQQRFTTDTTAIVEYLNTNSINAIKHESGIWYTIDEPSTGSIPAPYDYVTFDYKVSEMSNGVGHGEGTLSNHYVFDVIDGLKVGLSLIEKGTKATFYVPSTLAYGTSGSGTIPANANLIFEIHLKEVFPR